MTRRELIRNLALLLPAGVAAPSLLSSCKKDPGSGDAQQFFGSVLIIGAGPAGVYAAELLRKYGIDVTILEATSRSGGRILGNNSIGQMPVELGASHLYGRRSLLYDTVIASGQNLVHLEGDDVYWFQGQRRDLKYLRQGESLQGEGETLLQVMESFASYPGADQTLQSYLEGFPVDSRLWKIAKSIAGSRYGADPESIGMYALRAAEAGRVSGYDPYVLTDGTIWKVFEDSFPEALKKVQYNQVVRRIKYNGTKVVVDTGLGNSFTADKVLLTVPHAVLAAGDLLFEPVLPAQKLNAIQNIKTGHCIRVVIRFNFPFWEEKSRFVYGTNIATRYDFSSLRKSGKDKYVSALIVGKSAESMAALSEAQIAEAVLDDLAKTYYDKQVRASFSGHFLVKNWSAAPFIKGGISYPSPGSDILRNILAESVSEKLFFAGEACNSNGHQGTVHGAMESAVQAVKSILGI